MTTHSWAEDLVDLLLPPGCVACGGWVGRSGTLVCTRCRLRLHEPPWPRCRRCWHPRGTGRPDAPDCFECRSWPAALSAARFAWGLEGSAADLVHALKYEGWSELAGFMAASMARLDVPPAPGRRVVVPVPTTTARLRERGYNQAALLAEGIGRELGLPVYHALERSRGGRSQTALAPTERRENVRGAFRSRESAVRALTGADVLLIDDVLTTGATGAEAAGALAEGGAASVTLLAFARALPGRPRRAA